MRNSANHEIEKAFNPENAIAALHKVQPRYCRDKPLILNFGVTPKTNKLNIYWNSLNAFVDSLRY